MKKLQISFLALFVFFSSLYAQEDSFLKTGVGLNFSLLGIGPTVNLNLSNFELDTNLYFCTNTNSKRFAVSPSFSLGYNTNPFKKGYQNFIGASYILVTGGWIDSFLLLSEPAAESGNFNIHFLGITYKGSFQRNNGLSLNYSSTLPIVIFTTFNNEYESLWIFDGWGGLAANFLSSLLTFNLGLKYSF